MDSFYIESGFDQIMFRIVPIFIGMIFIIVIVGILQGIIQWKKIIIHLFYRWQQYW